ncbi:MFS general substrate transporter [Daedaleopsis nitida]|nr:MFS general substrate transporter [Daedaleopsis nitida]
MSAHAKNEVSGSIEETRSSADVEKQPGLSPSVDLGSNVDKDDYKARFPNINEAKVIRKIDVHLVPALCMIYLLSFLDRVNISNAVIFGLTQDLDLGPHGYNVALLVFFVPYILFEIPSNALLKRFRPHVWMSLCMFLFGLITLLQGLTRSLSGLVAARFFLGLAECGVFPACFYLIAMWYPRAETQKRFTFLFGSSAFAGAFGACSRARSGTWTARGLERVEMGVHHRAICMLTVYRSAAEGGVTVLLSGVLYFIIADFPEEVAWLDVEEKEFVKARLYEDVGDSKLEDRLTAKGMLEAMLDWKILASGFMYIGLNTAMYNFAYFAPTIIQTFGYDAIHTQLLSVPPWACAFVFAMLTAVVSDWARKRFVFLVGCITVSLTGFIILLVVHDHRHLQYGALFLAAMGGFSAMPIVLCWCNTNLGGHHRRAVGTAYQIGFGGFGGIIAAFSFVAKDAPRFTPGYSVCIASLSVALVSSTVYFVGVSRENRRRDTMQAAEAYVHLPDDEKKRMGDLDPDYRYFT